MNLHRSSPRFTVWFDFCFEWLKFDVSYHNGLGYFQWGWIFIGYGTGRGRDVIWDALDRGLKP